MSEPRSELSPGVTSRSRPEFLTWRKPQAGAVEEAGCRFSDRDRPSVHESESEPTFVLRTLDWVEGRLAGRSRVLRGGVRSLLFLGGVLALCAGVLMLVLPGPGLLTMLVGVGLMGQFTGPRGSLLKRWPKRLAPVGGGRKSGGGASARALVASTVDCDGCTV